MLRLIEDTLTDKPRDWLIFELPDDAPSDTLKLLYVYHGLSEDTLLYRLIATASLRDNVLCNVWTADDYRQLGLQSILLPLLCDILTYAGERSIVLHVRLDNAPAIALYHKLGFQRDPRAPLSHSGGILMYKSLGGAE